MTQKMNNTNTNNLNVFHESDDNNDEGDDDVGFWGGDPPEERGGVPLERAPSLRNEFLSEKKELCLGFRVSFNASLQFFFVWTSFCVLFVLFIYYKRLRRRRSDHLDFQTTKRSFFACTVMSSTLFSCAWMKKRATLSKGTWR